MFIVFVSCSGWPLFSDILGRSEKSKQTAFFVSPKTWQYSIELFAL